MRYDYDERLTADLKLGASKGFERAKEECKEAIKKHAARKKKLLNDFIFVTIYIIKSHLLC